MRDSTLFAIADTRPLSTHGRESAPSATAGFHSQQAFTARAEKDAGGGGGGLGRSCAVLVRARLGESSCARFAGRWQRLEEARSALPRMLKKELVQWSNCLLFA